MRRLGRWMLDALTALSLLLFVAASAVWVRSHWRCDQYQPAGGRWSFSTNLGRVWVDHTSIPYWTGNGHRVFPPNARFDAQFPMGFKTTRWAYTNPDRAGRTVSGLGFVYWRYYQTFAQTCWDTAVGVPLWFVTLVAVAVPALRVRRWLSRVPPGGCRRCGYDLTGNVSGACPECGAMTGV